MISHNLRLLQLNIMKSRPGMEALINDHHTQSLDILLIQEPPISAYCTHVSHTAWRRYQPTPAERTNQHESSWLVISTDNTPHGAADQSTMYLPIRLKNSSISSTTINYNGVYHVAYQHSGHSTNREKHLQSTSLLQTAPPRLSDAGFITTTTDQITAGLTRNGTYNPHAMLKLNQSEHTTERTGTLSVNRY